MEVHLAQLVRASKDAIYFTFSDRSAQEKLGIYREERQ
jgi:gentisate 1,2-dioxygenase